MQRAACSSLAEALKREENIVSGDAVERTVLHLMRNWNLLRSSLIAPLFTSTLCLRPTTPSLKPPSFSISSIPSAMVTTLQPTKPADHTKEDFKSVFPKLLDLLLTDLQKSFDLPKQSLAYIRKNLTYNVPHGKLNRGMAVFQCYTAFRSSPPSEHDHYLADVLGWCVELQQAFFLVADDIMDDSMTRRGQPCFFRIPEIGINAINDAMILESMIYRVLRLVFREHDAYPDLVHLFQEVTYTTEIGQLLDLTSQEEGPVQLDRFTDDVLARIYKYKTSHYTFYLPVALGMRLAGVKEDAKYETAKKICLELGHYFQAQDDFIDAFGDPEVTGKIGTDIEEKTCTWLIVQALKVCTEEDRKLLIENYGKKDDTVCSDRVKALYRRLKLPEAFQEFEQASYEKVRELIDEVAGMPTGAFEFLLAKIYKRNR